MVAAVNNDIMTHRVPTELSLRKGGEVSINNGYGINSGGQLVVHFIPI